MRKKRKQSLLDAALDNKMLSMGRATGNSTRMIDLAIQMLFDGFVVEVRDHHEYGKSQRANENLYRRILSRFSAEHSGTPLEVDKQKFEISLKD
jgi:hypothetical protein